MDPLRAGSVPCALLLRSVPRHFGARLCVACHASPSGTASSAPGTVALFTALAFPAFAQDAQSLTREAKNPFADLINLQFFYDATLRVMPANNTQQVLTIQPLIPIHLNSNWIVIHAQFCRSSRPGAAPGQSGSEDQVTPSLRRCFLLPGRRSGLGYRAGVSASDRDKQRLGPGQVGGGAGSSYPGGQAHTGEKADHGGDGEHADLHRGEPVLVLALIQHDLQRRHPDDEQQHADLVDRFDDRRILVDAGRWLRQQREQLTGKWLGALGVPRESLVICMGLGSPADDLAAELLVRLLRSERIDRPGSGVTPGIRGTGQLVG